MADGSTKNVENIRAGDKLMSFDDESGKIMPNEVSSVVMSCVCPKPMIELEYDGERITTTYDHYFYTGDGFTPLYQLIWGALETSQRAELQLLCKQYGQDCDNTFFWKKYSKDNVARKGQMRILQDGDGWKTCKSPQNYSGNLAGKPFESTAGESFRLQSKQQQNREPGMVFSKIQCLLWSSQWEHKNSNYINKPQESIRSSRASGDKKVLLGQYAKHDEPREDSRIRETVQEVQESVKAANYKVRNWSIKIKGATPYYTISMRAAPYSYCIGERHTYITHNSGKLPISVVWSAAKCKLTHKNKILVISTPSKALHTQDFQEGFDNFVSPEYRGSLNKLELTSWHRLHNWVNDHVKELDEWVVIADEIARVKGWTTRMGKNFLRIAKANPDWAGFTGTPGDKWVDYGAYFQACGFLRNKTNFMQRFARVQTFKGYPEIIGYNEEETLKKWWNAICYAPDTSMMESQIPESTSYLARVKKPSGYDKVLKTRIKLLAGEELTRPVEYEDILDNPSALTHYLRQLCFTKDKQDWIKDFVSDAGEPVVIFYNYTQTADAIEADMHKVDKSIRVWMIDGAHHEIPIEDTIGKRDVVLAQWQSGGEALNLQFIRYWISPELTYSYSQFTQAKGRIKRIGQTRPMFYYLLIAKGTIEEQILRCIEEKKDFNETIWLDESGLLSH